MPPTNFDKRSVFIKHAFRTREKFIGVSSRHVLLPFSGLAPKLAPIASYYNSYRAGEVWWLVARKKCATVAFR